MSTTLTGRRADRRASHLIAALLAGTCLGAGVAHAGPRPVSEIYTFGDSTADVGAFGERYTNRGQMWVERLGDALGHKVTAARIVDMTKLPADPNHFEFSELAWKKNGGNDYAFGGAAAYYGVPLAPAFADELAFFKQDHQSIDRNALTLIWKGGNDPFYALQIGTTFKVEPVVQAHVAMIDGLKGLGARNIVAFSEPTKLLYADPSYDPADIAQFSKDVAQSNAALRTAYTKAGVYVIDTGKLGDDVLAHLQQYGFKYGNDSQVCGDLPALPACDLPNDGHVFGVTGHFSSAMHAVVGDYALAQLQARDRFAELVQRPVGLVRQSRGAFDQRLFSRLPGEASPGVDGVLAFGGVTASRTGRAGKTDLMADSRVDKAGVYFGLDTLLSPNLLAGAAVSLDRAKFIAPQDTGRAHADLRTLHLFGAWSPTSAAHIDLTLSGAQVAFDDISRTAHLGAVATAKSSGDTSGLAASARVRGGYDFKVGAWRVTPNVAVTTDYSRLHGFSETGSVLDIAYGRSSYRGTSASAGVNIELADREAALRPYLAVDVSRALTDGTTRVMAGPDAKSLVAYRVEDPRKTQGHVAAGVRYRVTSALDLEAGVDGQSVSKDATDWSFHVGLSRHF